MLTQIKRVRKGTYAELNCCRFDQLIEYGQKMVASNPRMRQVKDRVTALKQEKVALKDTWCERNDLLNEGQDLQVSCPLLSSR